MDIRNICVCRTMGSKLDDDDRLCGEKMLDGSSSGFLGCVFAADFYLASAATVATYRQIVIVVVNVFSNIAQRALLL